MMVDHLTEFKGCTHHEPVIGDKAAGMREFNNDRQELLLTIPEFPDPDFAQVERLPVKARNPDDPESEVEDEWKIHAADPFYHMTPRSWRRCCETVGRVFTGGDDSDVEDGERMNRYLEIGKDDCMFDDSRKKRRMASGEATLDIDSVLALFTDLSMVNTKIRLSIGANPNKNLRQSVHISHRGTPLHWIPHFHLGQFGNDINFDLFIFLPSLYNRNQKRRKNNLFNHVTKQVRVEFMNECLLPAIQDVLDPNEKQSWDFDYELSEAKSIAASVEKIHGKQGDGISTWRAYDLDAKDIPAVWNNCHNRLLRAMRWNVPLRAFRGFQFFINSKGHKHRTHTGGLSELMATYKEKVWPWPVEADG